MRTVFTACAFAVFFVLPVLAQTLPFDMSPEASQAPVTDAAAAPADPAAAPVQAAPEPQAVSGPAKRFLLPSDQFVLSGEIASRSWSIYLTPEQAASSATLNLGYQSAIVVAPESSRLRVAINNTVLSDQPIQSSDSVLEVSTPVPSGLLKPGLNLVRFDAVQRNRTDCSIASTFDLWTDVDPAKTFLSFDEPGVGQLKRIDDIRAVGFDETGHTRLNMVVPAADQGATVPTVIRLAEGLAVLANMPNQSVSITRGDVTPDVGPGNLTVVMGTASELRGVLATVPEGGDVAPLSAFVDDPKLGWVLVVTGPTWEALSVAVESIVQPTDRPIDVARTVLSTQSWRSPDAPLLTSATRLKFVDLGAPTQEFSGRRFRTDFVVGVPSDFYANAYGEATLLLDAAYSAEVLPGSHIDVYVNDNIAATVPITTGGGEILRHLPISVTMRHFRPGANTIAIEAVLLTAADALCAPGATANDVSRFALFDTSEFVMPQFARIGQRPNLGAVAGTGFPYNRSATPIPLIIDHSDPETLSAAATMLARLSAAAGRPIEVDSSVSAETVGNRDALFIGPISQISNPALAQVGIAAESRTAWNDTATVDTSLQTSAAFNEWRNRLAGRGWRGQVSALEDWLNRNFDISLDSLRLTPRADTEFTPSGKATLVVAQGGSPDGAGTWTVVTAPTSKDLDDGMRSLAEQANWSRLGGHVTSYEAETADIKQVPVNTYAFVETQPASLTNYRLILSNWLSANILYYSALLAVFCVILGLMTAALLSTLGRRR